MNNHSDGEKAYFVIMACTKLLDAFHTDDCHPEGNLGDAKTPFIRAGLVEAIRMAATAIGDPKMDTKINEICLTMGRGKYHTDKTKPLAEITWGEIIQQAAEPINVEKSGGNWLIPSTLKTRDKSSQIEHGCFCLLTLDIDKDPPNVERLRSILTVVVGNAERVVYSTKSATVATPKARVLIPIPSCDYVTWHCAQRAFYQQLEAHGITPDISLLEPQQIIYLPNSGEHYVSHHTQGRIFNPVECWHDEMTEFWRQYFKPKPVTVQAALKENPPTTVNSSPSNHAISGMEAIRLFNATYPVGDILTQAGYDEHKGEYRHPNSNSGSYSVSIKDGKAHSLSSNDPLHLPNGGGGRDAFDCFATLFHEGNRREAMIDACLNWLEIDGVSVTAHNRAIHFLEQQGRAA